MAGARQPITIDIDDAELRAALKALAAHLADLTPVFRDLGEQLLNSTRERFRSSTAPDGTPWPPLAEATLLARVARKTKGHIVDRRYTGKNAGRWTKKAAMVYAYAKPLIDTGALMGMLDYQAHADELLVGTPEPYGATHQFGRGAIPARPFLGLSAADHVALLDTLRDHLARAVGAAP